MKENQNWKQGILPALTLSVLSVFIPEILMGSTPASRAEQWILEWIFYGSGVLLVGEIACRYRLKPISVILFGLAFGLIEEGLLLQSVFNPDFLNLDISYGRMWGVNWVWAQFIVVYHALFSISIPVFLARLAFLKYGGQPWLSKIGLAVVAGLYILTSFFYFTIFQSLSEFRAPVAGLVVVFLLAVVFVALAFLIKKKLFSESSDKSIPPVLTGVVSVMFSGLWLFGLREVFTKGDGLPSWVIQLSGIVLIGLLVILIYLRRNQRWSLKNQFSVLAGGTVAGAVYGLYINVQSGNRIDLIFQIIFISIALSLLVLLGNRLRQE